MEIPGLDEPRFGVPMHVISQQPSALAGTRSRSPCKGNTILVYYDGVLQINVTNNNYENFQAAHLSGGISAELHEVSPPVYHIGQKHIVTPCRQVNSNGVSAFDGGNGVQWQNVAWDAIAGGSTSLCVMTGTADTYLISWSMPPGQAAIPVVDQPSSVRIAVGSVPASSCLRPMHQHLLFRRDQNVLYSQRS